MFEYWKRKKQSTAPVSNVPIGYNPLPRPLQDSINYPWGYQVSYSQKQGENAWMGNQLPGATNFIPNVPESYSKWYIQRNVQLAGNYVLSRGGNGTVSNMGESKGNRIAQEQSAYWQSLKTTMPWSGIWQGNEL
jgi:hypothetical protein